MRRQKTNIYRVITLILIVLLAIALLLRAGPRKLLKNKPSKPQNKKSLKTPIKKSITIAAVGDVMFDRRVKSALISNGVGWPFAKVKPNLNADLTIINLESSTSSSGKATKGKDVTFQGTPLGAKALKAAGIDIAGLANNHALDYGLSSLKETRELLRKENIAFAGAGTNIDEAYQPAIIKAGDIKVGFLSFSDVVPLNSFPSKNSPGIANTRDIRKVAEKIKALDNKVHLTIVAFHWGVEYKDQPTSKQRELAVAAIDAGADLVLGTHPHVIQGVAVYKNRLIMYSLGNFVFDHFKPNTGESLILRANIDYKGRLRFARLLPILITDNGQPYVPDEAAGSRILSRMKNLSGKYKDLLKFEGNSLIIK